jgi:hypothetical protein
VKQIKDFDSQITPLIEEATRMLTAHRIEQAQIREIIVRFDAVISEKLNKATHETLVE